MNALENKQVWYRAFAAIVPYLPQNLLPELLALVRPNLFCYPDLHPTGPGRGAPAVTFSGGHFFMNPELSRRTDDICSRLAQLRDSL